MHITVASESLNPNGQHFIQVQRESNFTSDREKFRYLKAKVGVLIKKTEYHAQN